MAKSTNKPEECQECGDRAVFDSCEKCGKSLCDFCIETIIHFTLCPTHKREIDSIIEDWIEKGVKSID